MRTSSLLVLAGAVLLGIFAVVLAFRFLGQPSETQEAAAPTVTAVVATRDIAFGDPVTADVLQEIPWPAELPRGAYTSTIEAVGPGDRLAMRAISANEVVTSANISGEQARLSTSPLLGPDMRAVAVPLTEATGAGGFIAPGDKVDVFVTRDLGDNFRIADQLMQDVRVLAVGQVADTTRAEPEIVRTATLEVTPVQAQKISLAQKVGDITLALRSVADESRMVIPTIRMTDLHDGGGRNYQPPPRRDASPPAPPPAQAAQAGPPRPAGPSMTVVRGTETASMGVPR
jgi:pilus assembly protein CpaB